MSYLEHYIAFVKLLESICVKNYFQFTYVKSKSFMFGKVKLWGVSKIIETPIVYNFLSCNVRDMFCVSLLETSSSMLGDKFYHKWNYHKMINWIPWKWHRSDLIPENKWKHNIVVKDDCHKYFSWNHVILNFYQIILKGFFANGIWNNIVQNPKNNFDCPKKSHFEIDIKWLKSL
jgi:hypothetical protein